MNETTSGNIEKITVEGRKLRLETRKLTLNETNAITSTAGRAQGWSRGESEPHWPWPGHPTTLGLRSYAVLGCSTNSASQATDCHYAPYRLPFQRVCYVQNLVHRAHEPGYTQRPFRALHHRLLASRTFGTFFLGSSYLLKWD